MQTVKNPFAGIEHEKIGNAERSEIRENLKLFYKRTRFIKKKQ